MTSAAVLPGLPAADFELGWTCPSALYERFLGKYGLPSLWGGLCLFETLRYSEDQVACFHAYLVPEQWRGYFVVLGGLSLRECLEGTGTTLFAPGFVVPVGMDPRRGLHPGVPS